MRPGVQKGTEVQFFLNKVEISRVRSHNLRMAAFENLFSSPFLSLFSGESLLLELDHQLVDVGNLGAGLAHGRVLHRQDLLKKNRNQIINYFSLKALFS